MVVLVQFTLSSLKLSWCSKVSTVRLLALLSKLRAGALLVAGLGTRDHGIHTSSGAHLCKVGMNPEEVGKVV